jgi:hypothetical protein
MFTRLRLPLLAALLPAVLGLICHTGRQRDVRSNCDVDPQQPWIDAALDVIHERPNACPVRVPPQGGRTYTFEAAVFVPDFELYIPNDIMTVEIYDQLFFHQKQLLANFAENPANANEQRADVIGDYVAGRAGFDRFGQMQETDYADARVDTRNHGTANATVYLTYQMDQASTSISGPSDIEEGSSFAMSLQVYDPYAVWPVTHEWFSDGVSQGSPSSSMTSMSDAGRVAGSNQIYEVVTRDAAGYSHTAMHAVWVYFQGGCDDGC